MAQKILGVDIGTYSVKVVVAAAGLRSTTLVDFLEAPIPAPTGEARPVEERAALILAELLRARGLEHDLPYIGMAGDALSMRVLDFQFSGLKRADLDKAVGAELEAQLPHELDELLYDFDVLPRGPRGSETSDEDATTAGQKAQPPGTRVLAAATTHERVGKLIALTGQHGVDPRGLVAAPAAYGRAAERIGVATEPVVIIDHGHSRTNVAIVKHGKTVFARTISRGGRHVTNAIMRAWSLPTFEEAEHAKHADGFVASTREPAGSEAWERVSDVIKQELGPLVRDIRQTLAACRAQTGVSPRRAVLCGGGGRLRGLSTYLAEELELSIEPIPPGDAARLIGVPAAARGVAADGALLALGLALEGASGRPQFDLRRGPFAYRADFTFLRAKAGYLAAAALLVIAFAAGDAYAALYKLRKEEGILEERLKNVTTEVLGAPATLAEVEEKITPKKEESPLPKSTAFDQLVDISKKLPPRPELKLDVQELDIRRDKVIFKATTDSRAAIDDIEKSLKLIECFDPNMQRGKIVEDSSKEVAFTLTISSKCM